MKTLYLDCGMGAAGDMLAAALLALCPDQEQVLHQLNHMGLEGVAFTLERREKCGIYGHHLVVKVHGEEEGAPQPARKIFNPGSAVSLRTIPSAPGATGDHDHSHMHVHPHNHDHDHFHPHDHSHDHSHASMDHIGQVVAGLQLPQVVRDDMMAVYTLIAEAESRVHGVPVTAIHFHEVGEKDAIADIAAVSLLMHLLGPEQVVASPIHVGSGTVRCAHGVLPVPAPATALILKGMPIYSGEIRGELCTPTGAALLKHFVHQFGSMPLMAVEQVGYGMGTRDYPVVNCLRAVMGKQARNAHGDTVVTLSANLDDMSGEDLSFAADRLLQAGALDVWTQPIYMKKGRPGVMLSVLCPPEMEEQLAALMFRHTTTLGIRSLTTPRHVLDRRTETIHTPLGPVRRKMVCRGENEDGKWEYEDVAALAVAQDMPLRQVKRALNQQAAGAHEDGTD